MKNCERFHYMDNLRAIALLLGIFYHAALAYSPFMANIWFTADAKNHLIFDIITHWLHLFRMPVFFIIAGFFACLLIEKKGVKSFLSHRVKRVLLPFIVFFPLLAGLFLHALKWGAQFPDTLPAVFTLFEQVKDLPPSTMHLWFLWNLFGFSVLLSLLMCFRRLMLIVLKAITNKWVLLFALPLLITPALYSQFAPFPAPDKFIPQLWSYGFYGILFLVGVGIFMNQSVIKQLTPFTNYLFITAIISYSIFWQLMPSALTIEQVIKFTKDGFIGVSGIKHLILVLVQSISLVYWSLLALIFANRYLNHVNKITRYISDASYWVYLIHVPVLLYIQMPLLSLDISIYLKLLIALISTLAICFISYHLFVRFSLIGKLLSGLKHIRVSKAVTI